MNIDFSKKKINRDSPGRPVVNISRSNAGVAGLIPGQGASTPPASQPKNKKAETIL